MPYSVNRRFKKRFNARRRAPLNRRLGTSSRRMPLVRSVNMKRTAYSKHYFTRWLNLGTVYEAQGGGNGTQGLFMGQTGTTTFSYANGWFYNTIPSATTSYASIGYAPQFSNVTAFTDFTDLFDQYRILGVALRIVPAINSFEGNRASAVYNGSAIVSSALNGSLSVPVVHHALDYDDATNPSATETGINELRERWSYKVSRMDAGNKIFRRYFKPKVNMTGASGTGTATGIQKTTPWIDAADTDVSHYGFKAILEVINTSGAQLSINYKIEAKFYIQCRGPH